MGPSRIGIDPRALAAYRVLLGLLVLADLAYRSVDLVAFYTDRGALPRSALDPGAVWSVHMWSGAVWWQGVLFAAAAVAAVALLLGHRTRLAAIVSFVLLASLLARNPLVLNSGDPLLLLLLFWGLFLPLGARWAVDAEPPGRVRPVADVASAALLVQVVLVYAVNAVLKWQGGAWAAGEALRYAFVDQFTTGLGAAVAARPALLGPLGTGWFLLLLAAPLLILLTGRARAVLVALFMAGHLGMLLTMRIGLFPIVSLTALVPFLPPFVWDRLEQRIGRLVASRWQPAAAIGARAATPARSHRAIPTRRRPTKPVASRRAWPYRIGQATVAVALAVNLAASVWSVGWIGPPEPVAPFFDEHDRVWAMFADPPRAQVWYVAPATTADGQEVDALHGGPVDWDAPADLGPHPDIRWRKYLSRIEGQDDLQGHLARHLCAHPHLAVEDLRIVRVLLPTAPGATPSAVELSSHACPAP